MRIQEHTFSVRYLLATKLCRHRLYVCFLFHHSFLSSSSPPAFGVCRQPQGLHVKSLEMWHSVQGQSLDSEGAFNYANFLKSSPLPKLFLLCHSERSFKSLIAS